MERVLGLDLGTTSIGWWYLEYERIVVSAGSAPRYIGARTIDSGVRIFPEGMDRTKGEKSLNQDRRLARSLRRLGYRRVRRKQKLLKALQDCALLPTDSAQLNEIFRSADHDPYRLRAAALSRPLTAFEVGRALYHLGQRRGFLSNRKSGDAKEDGKVKTAIGELEGLIEAGGFKTLGEYLHSIDPALVRRRGRYTARAMYEQEFALIWEAQSAHHPQALNTANRLRIHDAIFDQRPLKTQRHLIGQCSFYPDRRRAYAATLAAQQFRLWQSINHLKITNSAGLTRHLTDDERHVLADELELKANRSWDQIRKSLGLFEHEVFNLEAVRKSGLMGNKTAYAMNKAMGGKFWKALGDKGQRELVFDLLNVEPESALKSRLLHHYSCSDEQAEKLIEASAGLPKGVMHLSHKAMGKILPYLRLSYARLSADEKNRLRVAKRAVPEEDRGLSYADACLLGTGKHHSDHRVDNKQETLPFPGKPTNLNVQPAKGSGNDKYRRSKQGQHGAALESDNNIAAELRNPLVARALYQLRRVVNALIRAHGKPTLIRVELARDLKLNARQRDEAERQNRLNERANEGAKNALIDNGIASPSRGDIQKFRLYEEAKHLCPYCGTSIRFQQLFNGEAEIEHIIPYSRCLDNSMANKTVAHRRCNAQKGNRTPWEAFTGERYEEILKCVKSYPLRKRKRFYADFTQGKDGEERDFVSQQLNETRYIAKKAAEYLSVLGCKVEVVKGGTTAILRRAWGLNGLLSEHGEKNRADHRHHAVDALVVALTDVRAVQVLSRKSALNPDSGHLRVEDYPAPIESLREHANEAVQAIVVSHKVNRKVRGQLHDDSLYAVTGERSARGLPIIAIRKPLEQLKAKDLESIRDPHIRKLALAHLAASDGHFDKAFKNEENPFVVETRSGKKQRIKKVRLLDTRSVHAIGSGPRQRHVWTRSNHHMEIIERTDAKGRIQWRCNVVSTLEANTRKKQQQAVESKAVKDGERFVMSLHINDMLLLEMNAEALICRVQKMDQTGELSLRPHFDDDKDAKAIRKKVNALRTLNARKIHVDMLGRYRIANE